MSRHTNVLESEADRHRLLIAVERMVREGSSTDEITATVRSLTGDDGNRAPRRRMRRLFLHTGR